MGLLIALQVQSLPTFLALTLLVALCLPMPRGTGHWLRRGFADAGYGLVRIVIAPLAALGILVAAQVSGALLQGAVAASAAKASAPVEQRLQRGPERSA